MLGFAHPRRMCEAEDGVRTRTSGSAVPSTAERTAAGDQPLLGTGCFPPRTRAWSASVSAYASALLALCNMRTLYLRNVPDEVVQRLERLARRDGTSVGAVAVRELADVTRRADNPALLGALPDLQVEPRQIVEDLTTERAAR